MPLSHDLKTELIATAHALADAARLETLKFFRQTGLIADNKEATRFDPVTVADRGAEAAMRKVLARLRPGDGILGEEFGPKSSDTGLTWVLDPIDGTRGFISGTPTWGVLIAVNGGQGPLFGLIDQPYIGERFAGGFGVAEVIGPMGQSALKTRPCRQLSEAVIFSTFPEVGSKGRRAEVVAILHHHHIQTGLGEGEGRQRSAGPRAHDHHLTALFDRTARVDVPGHVATAQNGAIPSAWSTSSRSK